MPVAHIEPVEEHESAGEEYSGGGDDEGYSADGDDEEDPADGDDEDDDDDEEEADDEDDDEQADQIGELSFRKFTIRPFSSRATAETQAVLHDRRQRARPASDRVRLSCRSRTMYVSPMTKIKWGRLIGEDGAPDQEVVVKILKRNDDNEGRTEFEALKRLAAAGLGERVCTIQCGGKIYLDGTSAATASAGPMSNLEEVEYDAVAMEHLPKKPAADLSGHEIVESMLYLVETIQEANKAKIHHRDVKPENLLWRSRSKSNEAALTQ